MAKRSLPQLEVAGKRVLVRVDFNIPIEQGVEVIASYDQRLRATLPTINYLLEQDCRVILCSHLGRPGGKEVEELRLKPVGNRLSELLGHPARSLEDCNGPEIEAQVDSMVPGQVVLLENLRFHPGEEKNDPASSPVSEPWLTACNGRLRRCAPCPRFYRGHNDRSALCHGPAGPAGS